MASCGIAGHRNEVATARGLRRRTLVLGLNIQEFIPADIPLDGLAERQEDQGSPLLEKLQGLRNFSVSGNELSLLGRGKKIQFSALLAVAPPWVVALAAICAQRRSAAKKPGPHV